MKYFCDRQGCKNQILVDSSICSSGIMDVPEKIFPNGVVLTRSVSRHECFDPKKGWFFLCSDCVDKFQEMDDVELAKLLANSLSGKVSEWPQLKPLLRRMAEKLEKHPHPDCFYNGGRGCMNLRLSGKG